MNREKKGIEKVQSVLGRWAPGDLAYIERLELDGDGKGSNLIIVGLLQRRGLGAWPDVDRALRRVSFRFTGVKFLHLKDFGGGYTQVMGFDIRSISEKGLENIDFQVEDYEGGNIGFMCSDVEVLEVDDEDMFLP